MDGLMTSAASHFGDSLWCSPHSPDRVPTDCSITYGDAATCNYKSKQTLTTLASWLAGDNDKSGNGEVLRDVHGGIRSSFRLVTINRQKNNHGKHELLVTKKDFTTLFNLLCLDITVMHLLHRRKEGFHIIQPSSPDATWTYYYSLYQFYTIIWSYDPTHLTTKALLINDVETDNKDSASNPFWKLDLYRESHAHPGYIALACLHFNIDRFDEMIDRQKDYIRDVDRRLGYLPRQYLPYSAATPRLADHPKDLDLGATAYYMGSARSRLLIISHWIGDMMPLFDLINMPISSKHFAAIADLHRPYLEQVTRELHNAGTFMQSYIKSTTTQTKSLSEKTGTHLTVLYNLNAQADTAASIELAKDSRTLALAAMRDSSAMKTIAVMTMVFLPATFFAALFAVPSLQWDASPVVQPTFWVYWAFTIPCTILVICVWYVFTSRERTHVHHLNKHEREGIVKRTKGLSGMNATLSPSKGFNGTLSVTDAADSSQSATPPAAHEPQTMPGTRARAAWRRISRSIHAQPPDNIV